MILLRIPFNYTKHNIYVDSLIEERESNGVFNHEDLFGDNEGQIRPKEHLDIITKGCKHPYNIVEEEYDDIIKDKIRLTNWKKGQEVWLPDWAFEIKVILNTNIINYACEGRDVFINRRDQIQRDRYRYTNRALQVGKLKKAGIYEKLYVSQN